MASTDITSLIYNTIYPQVCGIDQPLLQMLDSVLSLFYTESTELDQINVKLGFWPRANNIKILTSQLGANKSTIIQRCKKNIVK